MAAWTAAARQAATFSRLSAYRSVNTTSQGALLIQRRGLAGGGGKFSSSLDFSLNGIGMNLAEEWN